MSRSLSLAICVAMGCGHPAPPPAAPDHATRDAGIGVTTDAKPFTLDDDLPALATRAVAMYQELARALAESTDCAATTAKLQTIEAAYADVIAANSRVLHSGRDKIKQLHVALEPHQADFDAAAQAIVQSPAMTKCSQDPAFAHVIDALVGEGS